MNPGIERPRYKPSGRVDGKKLIPALGLLAAVSAGIAAALYGFLATGIYFAALSVALVILTFPVFINAAVKKSHCRNRTLAGVLGATCGLAGYLGYFHLDQCFRWDIPWTAIDRLPDYLAFRMETDQWEWVWKAMALRPQKAVPGVQPFRPLSQTNFLSWNWAGFLFDVFLLFMVFLAVAVSAAGKPYSEKQRRWCIREVLTLEQKWGQALGQALVNNTLGLWVESKPAKVVAYESHCKVSVWYIPASEEMEPDAEVFLAINKGQPFYLFPEEAGALTQLLPSLQELAGQPKTQLAREAEDLQISNTARISPVPSPYAGQYQKSGSEAIAKWLLFFLSFIPSLLAVTLLVGGTYILGELIKVPTNVLVGCVVGFGFLVIFFIRWWHDPEKPKAILFTIQFEHYLFCRMISQRPDFLVGPDDLEAVFADMVPRRLWFLASAKSKDHNGGLFLIDQQSRVIRFEGNWERYLIPAQAILACDIEAISEEQNVTTATFYAVVLQVRLGSGTWSCPLFRWPTSRVATTGSGRWPCAAGSRPSAAAASSNLSHKWSGPWLPIGQ